MFTNIMTLNELLPKKNDSINHKGGIVFLQFNFYVEFYPKKIYF